MYNKINYILVVFFFLSLVFIPTSALLAEDNINVNIKIRNNFTVGEEISFEYKVNKNDYDYIQLIPEITCKQEIPTLFPEMLRLDNQEYGVFKKYRGIVVSEDFPAQKCKAIVNIITPVEKKFEKEFAITSRLLVNAKILFCDDEKCKFKKNEFSLGEKVFFDVESNFKIPFAVSLEDSKGVKKIINIPSWYAFEKSGDYQVKIFSLSDSYSLAEEIYEISINNKRKKDSFCNKSINNDPDCLSQDKIADKVSSHDYDFKNLVLFLVLGFVTIVLIGTIFFLKRRKDNSNNNS